MGSLLKKKNLFLILLASQSDAHRIAPHRDPNPSQPRPIPSTYSSEARKTNDVIYFLKGNRTRTSKTMFPSEKPRKPRKPRKPIKPRKPKKKQKNLKKNKQKKTKKNKKNKK